MTDLRDMSPAEKHAALPERINTLEAILAWARAADRAG